MTRALGCIALALLTACGSATEPPDCATDPVLRLGDGRDRAELIVEIADSDAERQLGLMHRTSLGANRGMVFLFDGPTDSVFWMKDTLIPLSIAFWGEDGWIVAILDMQPCREDTCEIYRPGQLYVGAVEANLGYFDEHGIGPSDRVELVTPACQ